MMRRMEMEMMRGMGEATGLRELRRWDGCLAQCYRSTRAQHLIVLPLLSPTDPG
jgi:hypothetical protein